MIKNVIAGAVAVMAIVFTSCSPKMANSTTSATGSNTGTQLTTNSSQPAEQQATLSTDASVPASSQIRVSDPSAVKKVATAQNQ